MRISTDNLENLTTRRGLYRVWMPASKGEPTPVVARWVDPQAAMRELQEGDDSSGKEEARRIWLRISLQFA